MNAWHSEPTLKTTVVGYLQDHLAANGEPYPLTAADFDAAIVRSGFDLRPHKDMLLGFDSRFLWMLLWGLDSRAPDVGSKWFTDVLDATAPGANTRLLYGRWVRDFAAPRLAAIDPVKEIDAVADLFAADSIPTGDDVEPIAVELRTWGTPMSHALLSIMYAAAIPDRSEPEDDRLPDRAHEEAIMAREAAAHGRRHEEAVRTKTREEYAAEKAAILEARAEQEAAETFTLRRSRLAAAKASADAALRAAERTKDEEAIAAAQIAARDAERALATLDATKAREDARIATINSTTADLDKFYTDSAMTVAEQVARTVPEDGGGVVRALNLCLSVATDPSDVDQSSNTFVADHCDWLLANVPLLPLGPAIPLASWRALVDRAHHVIDGMRV